MIKHILISLSAISSFAQGFGSFGLDQPYFAGTGSGGFNPGPPPPSCVPNYFYWTLDEASGPARSDSVTNAQIAGTVNTTAVSGLYNNGVKVNTAPTESGLFGQPITELAYDNTTTGFSMNYWVQLIQGETGFVNGEALITWWDSLFNDSATIELNWLPGTKVLAMSHADSLSGATVNTSGGIYAPPFDPSTNSWHMFSVVWNKTNSTLGLYIDATLMTNIVDTITSSNLVGGTGKISVFNTASGSHTFWYNIDELFVSTKFPLSQAQITQLYNSGSGRTWPGTTNAVVSKCN